jgi:uncharacterized RDD family membrane protein YckC
MSVAQLITCDHRSVEAVARCLVCGKALCETCAVAVNSHQVCAADAVEMRLQRGREPPLELPHPDITTRAIAWAIDGAILFGAGAFMLLVVMVLTRHACSFTTALLAGAALFTALSAVYATYFVCRRGQTPGQSLFHLRVVDLDGRMVNARQAFLRWVGSCLSVAALGYGFLTAASDVLGQGWHDKLAGTVVVGLSLTRAEKIRAAAMLLAVLVLEAAYAVFALCVR